MKSLSMYSGALLMLVALQLGAQNPAPTVEPISASQLKLLLDEMKLGDVETPMIHQQLERQRATLPAWFPAAVWDDVERRAEAIPYHEVALPVYQKYMTSEQADVMILLFKGPTGQAIAATLSGRADAAALAGHGGADSDREVKKSIEGDSNIQALFLKRLSEMTPEERAHLQAVAPGAQSVLPKVEDESDAAWNRKVNEVTQLVLAEHEADIAKAQAAAAKPH